MSKSPQRHARRPQAKRTPSRKGVTRPPATKSRQKAAERPRDASGRFLSAETVRRRQSFIHGRQARERTEARLTPAQKAARTREAHRIEREALHRRRSDAARKGWATRRRHLGIKKPKPPGKGPEPTRSRRSLTPSQTLRGSRKPTPRASGLPESRRPRRETGAPRSRASKRLTPKSKRGTRKSTATTTTKPTSTGERMVEVGDRLKVQIQVRWELPEGMEPSSRLLYEATAYRAEQGEDYPRFTTRILRWSNPGRLTEHGRAWRQGNQGDAWDSLGPAIAAFARAEAAQVTV